MATSNDAGGQGVERLAVDFARRDDVGQSRGARIGGGEVEQRRRDVGGEHMAGRADPPRRGERLLAGAGRHVEHAAAGSDARQVEHRLGRIAEPARRGTAPSGAMPRPRPAIARVWWS